MPEIIVFRVRHSRTSARVVYRGLFPFLAAAGLNEFRGPWNRFDGIPAALRSVRGNDKEQKNPLDRDRIIDCARNIRVSLRCKLRCAPRERGTKAIIGRYAFEIARILGEKLLNDDPIAFHNPAATCHFLEPSMSLQSLSSVG